MTMALDAGDWAFLAVYPCVTLLLSFSYYLEKTQEPGADYYYCITMEAGSWDGFPWEWVSWPRRAAP
jgi:hypothetical protein